jgi:hypothetical protein
MSDVAIDDLIGSESSLTFSFDETSAMPDTRVSRQI